MREREIRILADGAILVGDLTDAPDAQGVVVFAHGSGSSRHSSRNRQVAGQLQQIGFATLLMDLLTVEEDEREKRGAMQRFDIGMLADRLAAATDWLAADADVSTLPIGYFGASTGAAAALVASLRHPNRIRAIVSRGGRPDLAGAALADVQAPTLLIVGSLDVAVIRMNEEAFSQLGSGEKHLEIVPGASHLFEEPGSLDQVSSLASDWFRKHLGVGRPVGGMRQGAGGSLG